jgi:hypothetical protein
MNVEYVDTVRNRAIKQFRVVIDEDCARPTMVLVRDMVEVLDLVATLTLRSADASDIVPDAATLRKTYHVMSDVHAEFRLKGW